MEGEAREVIAQRPPVKSNGIACRWEHFPHQADMGIRGNGATPEEAFEQAAMALTAVVADLDSIAPQQRVDVECRAPDPELLFVDWLNALVFEMSTRSLLFSRYEVHIENGRLHGHAWGEPVDIARHLPRVEVKGATYTGLRVARAGEGRWLAECVVDV